MGTGGIHGFIVPSEEQPRRPGECQNYDITLVGPSGHCFAEWDGLSGKNKMDAWPDVVLNTVASAYMQCIYTIPMWIPGWSYAAKLSNGIPKSDQQSGEAWCDVS